MSDLIDRQKALAEVEEWDPIPHPGQYVVDHVKQWLKNFPAADVVEVVRCKDCKYSSANGKYGCVCKYNERYETHEMYGDDFCSHGERRQK